MIFITFHFCVIIFRTVITFATGGRNWISLAVCKWKSWWSLSGQNLFGWSLYCFILTHFYFYLKYKKYGFIFRGHLAFLTLNPWTKDPCNFLTARFASVLLCISTNPNPPGFLATQQLTTCPYCEKISWNKSWYTKTF